MQYPILKNEFKNPILKIDEADGKPLGFQGPYVDALFEALKEAEAFLFDDVANDAWDCPEQLGSEAGGAFLARSEAFGFGDQIALGNLLKDKGWTSKQVRYEFDNGEILEGVLYVPPLEITHREPTAVEAAGGVKEGPVTDAFRAVVGELEEGTELWQVDDEQVWIKGCGITREQRQALKYYGWYNLMNNEVDGIVMGFDRWALPAHMLPPKGRRTARPERTNPGTPDEQLSRVLPNPLPCWHWDGKNLVANGDQVNRMTFDQRNVDFPGQCNALSGAGWSENITKDFFTGLKTWRYSVPSAQYAPASAWEALTLLQPRGGWFDEGRCVEEGDTVRWRKDLDERAYNEAVSLSKQASYHPCFSVTQGYDEITYRFKPGNGF